MQPVCLKLAKRLWLCCRSESINKEEGKGQIRFFYNKDKISNRNKKEKS